jgi:hypothetical protein
MLAHKRLACCIAACCDANLQAAHNCSCDADAQMTSSLHWGLLCCLSAGGTTAAAALVRRWLLDFVNVGSLHCGEL